METALVRFYGVVCLALIYPDSFELIGKNKFSQFFLNAYMYLCLGCINAYNFIGFLFNFKQIEGFKLEVLHYFNFDEEEEKDE